MWCTWHGLGGSYRSSTASGSLRTALAVPGLGKTFSTVPVLVRLFGLPGKRIQIYGVS